MSSHSRLLTWAAVDLVKRQRFLSTKSATKTAELQLRNIVAAQFSAPTRIRRMISLGKKKDKGVSRQPQVCLSAKANKLGAHRISLGHLLITKCIETKNCYPEVGRKLYCLFFLVQFTLVAPLQSGGAGSSNLPQTMGGLGSARHLP